jgi:hypothetical protein
VLTICDNAKQSCPVFFGKAVRLHHSFRDPAAVEGTSEIRLGAFRKVRDELLGCWTERLLPTAIASLLDFEFLAIQTSVGMFAFLVCHKRILGAEMANGHQGRKAACRLLLAGVRAVPF